MPHTPAPRYRRRVGAALLAFSTAAVLFPASAFAIDDDPNWPEPTEPVPTTFTPPAAGFDWSVPQRFTQRSDGRYDWHWNESTATYDPAYVRPTSWPVDLMGCRTQEDFSSRTATANTYEFLTADGQRVVGRSCAPQLRFSSEGTYAVRMKVTAPSGAVLGTWTQDVVVKDLLIVSLGDSYASGEGNPEYARTSGQALGDWVDDRCHRSSVAGPAQAARQIEREDPKTSVTFLSFACSGGTINRVMSGDVDAWDPWKPGDPAKLVGSGILGPYRGVQPPNPDDFSSRVPSQVDQLKTALAVGSVPAGGRRQVDALLLSAGGNDAGFGLVATACLSSDYCIDDYYTSPDTNKYRFETRVGQDLAAMPSRYDALAAALSPASLGVDVKSTYITEYPDPGTERRADSGQVEECEEILEDVMWALGMEIEGRQWIRGAYASDWQNRTTELGYSRKTFLPRLNGAIADASARHGWVMVGGISAGMAGHGYCVGANDSDHPDRFIQTAAMSAKAQGPDAREKTTGTLHPNARGHSVFRDRILASAREQLRQAQPDRNLRFSFDTTAPSATASLSPATPASGWYRSPVTVTITGQSGATSSIVRVDHRVDGGSWLSTAGNRVDVVVSGTGDHTVEYRTVDSLDRMSAIASRSVRVDVTNPTVSLGSPRGGSTYELASQVVASYSCGDAASGLATCIGTRASGSAIDTGSIGFKTFTVRATDRAGNETSRSVTYQVVAVVDDPVDPCSSVTKSGTTAMLPC
jgi:hypothetical protein